MRLFWTLAAMGDTNRVVALALFFSLILGYVRGAHLGIPSLSCLGSCLAAWVDVRVGSRLEVRIEDYMRWRGQWCLVHTTYYVCVPGCPD